MRYAAFRVVPYLARTHVTVPLRPLVEESPSDDEPEGIG